MRRIMAMAVIVTAILAGSAPGSLAHDQGYATGDGHNGGGWEWRLYHAIGYITSTKSCGGEVNSNYVKSLKAILWADEQIADMSYINTTYNSTTNSNVRAYQSDHGLGVDGCAGQETLNNMQDARHWSSLAGVYLYHLVADGNSGGGGYYRWQEELNSRYVRYFKYCSGCGGIYGYEHGCWHVMKVVNTSNGNSTTFNNSRIDHDGDGTCD